MSQHRLPAVTGAGTRTGAWAGITVNPPAEGRPEVESWVRGQYWTGKRVFLPFFGKKNAKWLLLFLFYQVFCVKAVGENLPALGDFQSLLRLRRSSPSLQFHSGLLLPKRAQDCCGKEEDLETFKWEWRRKQLVQWHNIIESCVVLYLGKSWLEKAVRKKNPV